MIIGNDRVTAVEVERTMIDSDGFVVGIGDGQTLAADLVVRSVGYRGLPLPGVPFDESTGRVPHSEGRVIRDGGFSPDEYVTGWIKRGPTGVIGTNSPTLWRRSPHCWPICMMVRSVPGEIGTSGPAARATGHSCRWDAGLAPHRRSGGGAGRPPWAAAHYAGAPPGAAGGGGDDERRCSPDASLGRSTRGFRSAVRPFVAHCGQNVVER